MRSSPIRLALLIAAGLAASASAGAASYPVRIAPDGTMAGKVTEVSADGSVVVKVKGEGPVRFSLPDGCRFPPVGPSVGDKVVVGFLGPDDKRFDKRWVQMAVKNGLTIEPHFDAVEAPKAPVGKALQPADSPADPVVWTGAKPAPEAPTAPSAAPPASGVPCFITTAVVRALGAADDGPELTLARSFRATFMAQTAERRADVAAYHEVAPPIVAAVDALPNADAVWAAVWEDHLRPIKAQIERGELSAAHQAYRSMVIDLQRALGLGTQP